MIQLYILLLLQTSVYSLVANDVDNDFAPGFKLVEKDIVEDSWSAFRNAHSSRRKLWPSATIPFQFGRSFSASSKKEITEAFQFIEDRTCIRFKPRQYEDDYLKIVSKDGCWSYVGRQGGSQKISLPSGCRNLQTAVHEIMHALGFFHEHNRFDRDTYLDIKFENIEKDLHDQFKRRSQWKTLLFRKFDFLSTMLYAPDEFSKNGRNTIVSRIRGKSVLKDIHKPVMSPGDILSINQLYKCTGY